MNARQVIEAETPRSLIRQYKDKSITIEKISQALKPYGFTEYPPGTRIGDIRPMSGMQKVQGLGKFGRKRYTVLPILVGANRGQAVIVYDRDFGGGVWQFQENIPISDMDSLMRHLRIFDLLKRQWIQPELGESVLSLDPEGNVKL